MTPPLGPSYRLIPLTRGQMARVSPHRFEELSAFKWKAIWNESAQTFYAARTVRGPNGKLRSVWMHRQILGLPSIDIDPRQIDHQNHNTLDNTDGNIRIATSTQQNWNKRRLKNNLSGFKGVFYSHERECYMAFIKVNGKRIYLGRFQDPRRAARVYDAAALEYFEEFACLNFPKED